MTNFMINNRTDASENDVVFVLTGSAHKARRSLHWGRLNTIKYATKYTTKMKGKLSYVA